MSFTSLLIVIFIILATLVVYGLALNLHGMWGDEFIRITAISGKIVQPGPNFTRYGSYASTLDGLIPYLYQPAWYLLQHAIGDALACNSVNCLRIPNLVIFTLCLPIFFLFASNLSRSARLIALVFFVFNGATMMFVIEVREYPLVFLSIMLSYAIFTQMCDRILQEDRPPRFIAGLLYTGSLLLAFFSHLFAPIFLASPFAVSWLVGRRARQLTVFLLMTSALAALLALPYVLSPDFLVKMQAANAHWDNRTPTVSLLVEDLGLGLNYILFGGGLAWIDAIPRSPALLADPGPSIALPLLLRHYSIPLVSLAAILLLAALRPNRTARDWIRIGLVCVPSLIYLTMQIVTAMRHDLQIVWPRFFFFYLFPMAYLVGEAYMGIAGIVRGAAPRLIGRSIVIGMVTFSGIAQVTYRFQGSKEDLGCDMRVATESIPQLNESRLPLISDHMLTTAAYSYYDRTGRPIIWAPAPVAPADPPSGSFWYVRPGSSDAALDLLKRLFPRDSPTVQATYSNSCGDTAFLVKRESGPPDRSGP